MSKSALSNLTLAAKPSKATDLLGKRKEKLLNNLSLQKQLIQGLIDNESVVIYREKYVKDKNGTMELQRTPRKVNKWFSQAGGLWYLTPRIGTAKLELAKGMTSIEVQEKEDLLEVVDSES